jgi:phage-related protein
MPPTYVVIYAEDNGAAPLLEWLDGIPAKAQHKCIVRIERLKEQGHELRRPEADILRDGVYELRVRHLRVNYRILYGFHQGQAVLLHGLTKEDAVPDRDINMALTRKQVFAEDPEKHTYQE